MRVATLLVIFSLSAYLSSAGQTPIATVTTDMQALSILQRSLAALSPNIVVQDITLSGSAHYIAGSDDETGTAVLQATALGDSRLDLTLPSGVITEIDNLSATSPAGAWFAGDRTPHIIALHNLLAETAWFASRHPHEARGTSIRGQKVTASADRTGFPPLWPPSRVTPAARLLTVALDRGFASGFVATMRGMGLSADVGEYSRPSDVSPEAHQGCRI